MISRRQIWLSLGLIVLALAVTGFALWRGDTDSTTQAGHDHAAMSAANGDVAPVRLDAAAQRRIGVTYAVAERLVLANAVRAVGTITVDETRVSSINPRIEGWIERLHVDFTGAAVHKGQTLMDVYSPMLVSAQEELVLARRLLDETAADPDSRAAQNARELLEAARRRLTYWGIAADDIAHIEHTGPRRTLPLRATSSGVVVEKNVVTGARIMPGMELYRLADLARVWIEIDVFEKDIAAIALGTHAVVRLASYAGQTFAGRVTFVAPSIAPETRTARVRIELANPAQLLKPGMYGDVELHPGSGEPRLVVPRSAVLTTGTRTIVYVRAVDGTLVPRPVTTGQPFDSLIEITSGIEAGDVVVASASFLIDAESSMGAAIGDHTTAATPVQPGSSAAPAPAAPAAPAHSGHAGH